MLKDKLFNFGERYLIKEKIKKNIKLYGGYDLILEDSASFKVPSSSENLWITIDPSPVPNLVHKIGLGNYYHSGWFSVVKSLSDLAAVGAIPLISVIAVNFPFNMQTKDFDLFFKGAVECSKEHGAQLIGGNIKEARGKHAHSVTTSVGYTEKKRYLKRGKANPGDVLFAIDKSDFAGYWAGIATYIYKEKFSIIPKKTIKELQSYALKPKAKIKAASLMLKTSLINFCMDNSDGLLASTFELAETSGVDVVLSLNHKNFQQTVTEVANICDCDPRVWALGWGNCNLLCATDKKNYAKIERVLKNNTIEPVVIGEIHKGPGNIKIKIDNSERIIENIGYLSGEQFKSDSFWQFGIDSYINEMMNSKLPDFLHVK